MAAAAVDVGYLAASYSVPEPTVHSLLSAPTVELVQSFLVQVEAKAREYDELKSEKLRSDVELESAIRDGETRARLLKASTDKSLKETEELRQKLSQEETAREQIETELQTLKSSATTSTSELQTLESRIKTLESQNRDTVALHEAKSAAHDRLAEELATQHQKFVALRKKASELEEKCQSLENTATGVRFREQNLTQEIELLKKNNDWYESELQTRTADNTKFRKEKNAQISELQRTNADASQTIETIRRTEASLRQNVQLLEQQLEAKIVTTEQLQNQASLNQESFRAELDNARRLATLHQESANTAKAHLHEVKEQLEQSYDNAAQELGQLQAEIETERIEREKFERSTAELEKQVETLESVISDQRSVANVPATPRRGMNSAFDTPGRAGSPSIMTPGGSRIRGGLSTTQLYTENSQLKVELRKYQERDEARTVTMNDMLEELEKRQPEIEELRQENDRLTTETGEMSAFLEQSIADRETARKETRKAQGDYQGLLRECDLQRQQLRDISSQVNLLLLQQQVREQGHESLTADEQQYLLLVSQGGVPDDQLDDTTATGQLISKHLVLFKDIISLKHQNDELLRTIRQLGEQYEGTEARAKTNQAEKDREELEQLREKAARYEEEVKSLNIRSKSYMKERDMFRRIVTSRGQLPGSDAASMFDQSTGEMAIATPPRTHLSQSVDQTPHSKEVAGYERLVKDLQAHLDALRQESATDQATLKKQVDDLAKENNRLQNNVMQLNNANQLSGERYEFLQSRLKLLQSENNEIQKKCDSLQDSAAKQDIRTQQATEELVEAKSLVDSLERENTNLKQSQSLSKTIEIRFSEDNKALIEERGRLNKMISDLQNLRNEQDLTDAENRRRLQSRAESLEAELQNVKRKLEDEVDDHRKASMRREYEQTETRKQLDDLTKALSNIRPELASVKAERDQLQARVDELKVELRDAEERGQNMHSRLAPTPNGSAEANEDSLSREEELNNEILSLKHELQAVSEQAETAKLDIETYKTIAQDAEEQLDNYNRTSDELQQETDRVTAEKEAKIVDLEQRVEGISSELATTNSELSELRRTHEEEDLRLVQQKDLLETELIRVKDEAEGLKNTAAFHEEDKKAQADIATRAQQNYEHEVGKHGETMNNLRDIREKHNELKTTIAQYKAESEAALASLAHGEAHWAETRDRYERELAEGRTRYSDLNDQNKILHQQLESINSQISSLKTSRVSVAGSDADAPNADADVGGLQDIIHFLRREKEIVEIQHEMSLQEAKRLKLQLDNTQSQLDEAREKLSAEQQSQTQNQQNASSLKTLQDTVEQLNVYRESSSSLRNEARQAQDRLKEKTEEVERLYDQIQPLQARLQEIEGELAIKGGEVELLQRDRDHWQKRHQDVLQKYDRIDPIELEALKTQLENLQNELDQAREQISGAEERLNTEKAAIREEVEEAAKERRLALITTSKEKVRGMNQTIKERDATIQAITTERDELRQQLTTVQQELEETKTARDEAIANTDTGMGEEGQIDESNSGLSTEEREALEAKIVAADRRAVEESNRGVALSIQAQALSSRVRELENQAGELQQRIAALNTEVSQAQSQMKQAEEHVQELESRLSSADPSAAQSSEDIEKLKQKLAAVQKEAEDLRTHVNVSESFVGNSLEGGFKPVPEEVAEQVAAIKADLDAQFDARVDKASDASMEVKLKERSDKMKAKLNAQLKQGRQENEERLEQLRSEHQAELDRIRQEAQDLASRNGQSAPKDDTGTTSIAVKTEGLPSSDATVKQVQDWIANNQTAKDILGRNIRAKVEQAKQEQERLHAVKLEEVTATLKAEQEKASAVKAAEANGCFTSAQLDIAKARVRDEEDKKWKAKSSLITNQRATANAKLAVVEKAAKETPERPVGEVWEVAKVARAPPAQAPTPAAMPATVSAPAPTPTPAEGQAPAPSTDSREIPSTTTEIVQPIQPSATLQTGASQTPAEQNQPNTLPAPQTSAVPQTNGTTTGFGQSSFGQPSFGQPAAQTGSFGRPSGMPLQANTPFQQHSQGPGFQRPGQMNSAGPGLGLGFGVFGGSLPQHGFVAQNQLPQNNLNNGRPNSPFNQQQPQIQQPQQGGRGNFGTGPGALRGLTGAQGTGIPRGGGIPRPGGRGGQNQQTQPQSQNQNQVPNTPGAGVGGSQIGRGGGNNGGGRGRGGRSGGGSGGGNIQTNLPVGHSQGQGQNSPRTLNPGAQQFQPPGAGRGQKRDREDGGSEEGGQKGGKRPFRGRGGGEP